MKAVGKVRRERGIEVIESPPDPVGTGQVQLKMRAASICGSDLGFYEFTPSYQRFAKVPVIMGHEFAGEITKVGEGVAAFTEGEKVSVESVIYCGTCRFCRSGMTNICRDFRVFGMHVNGGFAELASVDSRLLHRLPDSVGFREAGIVEPLSVVMNAMNDVARQGFWRNALVVGPGPLGLLSAEVLKSKGVTDVLLVGVNVDATRLEIARKMGFSTVNSQEDDPLERSKSITDGYGFDVSIVAAGAGEALRTALALTSKGGQVIVLGIFPDEVPVPVSDAVRRQVSISGSYGSRWIHYEQAIQMLSEKKVRADAIVTHQFRLDDAQKAFETAKSKSGCKVQFTA